PPRPDPGVEIGDDLAVRVATAQNKSDQRRRDENCRNAGEQQQRLLAGAHGSSSIGGASASKAARLRSRNRGFSSPGETDTGVPKVTVQSSGRGMISPLGRTRLRLSIHTGTSSTSGRALARRRSEERRVGKECGCQSPP